MDSAYDMLLKRRTIRSFRSEAVPRQVMEEIVRAARYAPSAMGLQNRHFTIIENRQLLDDIVTATRRNGGKFVSGHVPFYNAPDAVVLSAPKDFKYNREDLGCAAQNMMLAAYSLGLGSCYLASIQPGLRDETILPRLLLPQNYLPFAGICIGYPAQEAPEPKERRTDDATWIR